MNKGEFLYRQGDAAAGAYCLLDGAIRAFVTSREGQEAILALYGPGQWFGETDVILGIPRLESAIAHSRASVFFIANENFESSMSAHPQFLRALLMLETDRLRAVRGTFEAYNMLSTEQKLADRILALIELFGSDGARGIDVQVPVHQEQLAHLIGTTRQRVSQILKDWKSKKILGHCNGRFKIFNLGELKSLAGRDSALLSVEL
ncbi:Crp/Fnr family transcriptional regulator [Burkholderia cepacia]|uniref:Crp/Fnr family transcriptional regulator n=1 Tax=Burkholderia cepacia TaxID=292 RepID=UPI0026526C1C|nr:Crp/Fnr family transcriptional regulator [Burkholderia cepacia]MDN7638820.1 Crp/Fnr family transcriptional regulator [Burkholderia cepacia]